MKPSSASLVEHSYALGPSNGQTKETVAKRPNLNTQANTIRARNDSGLAIGPEDHIAKNVRLVVAPESETACDAGSSFDMRAIVQGFALQRAEDISAFPGSSDHLQKVVSVAITETNEEETQPELNDIRWPGKNNDSLFLKQESSASTEPAHISPQSKAPTNLLHLEVQQQNDEQLGKIPSSAQSLLPSPTDPGSPKIHTPNHRNHPPPSTSSFHPNAPTTADPGTISDTLSPRWWSTTVNKVRNKATADVGLKHLRHRRDSKSELHPHSNDGSAKTNGWFGKSKGQTKAHPQPTSRNKRDEDDVIDVMNLPKIKRSSTVLAMIPGQEIKAAAMVEEPAPIENADGCVVERFILGNGNQPIDALDGKEQENLRLKNLECRARRRSESSYSQERRKGSVPSLGSLNIIGIIRAHSV